MAQSYHHIKLKRVYDAVEADDGIRLLADRLWPRGIKRNDLEYSQWIKPLCPSNALRKRWHNGELDFSAFRTSYLTELAQHRHELRELSHSLQQHDLTLLSAVKEVEHSHLVVLREYLYELAEAFSSDRINEPASPVCYQTDQDL